MSVARRRSKFFVLAAAVAGLALALSACAFFKEGSLSVSQPKGIGNARVHFVLCTEPEGSTCEPNEEHEPPQGNETVQYLVGIAVPKGAAAPATFTAQPITPGSQPITFTRNDQVASEMAASSAQLAEAELPPEAIEEIKPWPPSGLEGIGYLSTPVEEEEGSLDEWGVDAEFGLPVPSDGSPFTGPFVAATAEGAREVSPEHPADAPVHCFRIEEESFEPGDAFCSPTAEEVQAGTSDLKIAAPATASVFVGGNASVQFPMNFASTAGSAPTFNVTAGSSLPGATAVVSAPSFSPPAVDPSTHRSSGSETVTVAVPKTAAPGVYEVTITATTPQGGTATQVAKLEVTKPKLKVGKAKLNKRNGTAKLSVGVPGAGTLTASGKGIVKAKRSAKGPKTVKITIKAKGKAKKKLGATGKAKVKVKLVFKPENGASVTKTKSIVLKKKLT